MTKTSLRDKKYFKTLKFELEKNQNKHPIQIKYRKNLNQNKINSSRSTELLKTDDWQISWPDKSLSNASLNMANATSWLSAH